MIFQYGRDEVDPLNWQRLLSAEVKKGIPIQTGPGTCEYYLPENSIYLIDSWFFQVQTSAIAHNRLVSLQVADKQGLNLWYSAPPFFQPASTIVQYNFVREILTSPLIGLTAAINIPNIPIMNCLEIFSTVSGIQIGDLVTFEHFYYRELLLNKP